ncbi:MAG: hypothetical protein KKB50_14130 [Planctomycetes bacterium]|nr:hypothetical protein [Planctomycetota bacterium]
MSTWMLTIVAVGTAAGLLVVHSFGKTRSAALSMLDEYRKMLADARETKAKEAEKDEH